MIGHDSLTLSDKHMILNLPCMHVVFKIIIFSYLLYMYISVVMISVH